MPLILKVSYYLSHKTVTSDSKYDDAYSRYYRRDLSNKQYQTMKETIQK